MYLMKPNDPNDPCFFLSLDLGFAGAPTFKNRGHEGRSRYITGSDYSTNFQSWGYTLGNL